MTDRELLEMAAKAAGIKLTFWRDAAVLRDKKSPLGLDIAWNPLTDDGDALRLAVKLRISIEHPNPLDLGGGYISACVWRAHYKYRLGSDLRVNENFDSDPCAATRRAIVRAATEIGKEMK